MPAMPTMTTTPWLTARTTVPPLTTNLNQANADGDAQGDVCDTDDDNDGALDAADNCPLVSNADQLNTDGHGRRRRRVRYR